MEYIRPLVTAAVYMNEATNSSGAYTKTLPANRFKMPPGVVVTPRTAASFDWYVTTAGTAEAGFVIAIQFIKRKNSIVGILSSIGLVESNSGVVNFDLICLEQIGALGELS